MLRNRGVRSRRLAIARVPGGVDALIRFEGLFFLPTNARVVHDLGLVGGGRAESTRVRLRAGSYVVVALEGIAVAAARPLTVS